MKYNKPEIEIIFLNVADVITASVPSAFEIDDEWDPFKQ